MTRDTSRLRMGVLGIVVLSLFSALLARLWYLQVLAAPTYRTEAQLNSVRFVYTEAPRGRILDRDGEVLVGNRVVSTVVVDREEDRKDPLLLGRLAALIGKPEDELRRRMEDQRYGPFRPVPVADNVDKEKLIAIRERQGDFPGVSGVMLTQRTYPHGSLASHVLGYVGEINDRELEARKSGGYRAGDNVGKLGVELAYEDELRGEPEVEKLEVDAKGRVLRSLGKQLAVPGSDIRLTLDVDVQRVAEEGLAESIRLARDTYDDETKKRFLAPAGSAVVVDPRNGAVVAMASVPSYDPREFVEGISVETFARLQDPAGHYPLNNRAISGLYSPASTFKLVTSLAGLEQGLITPNTTYNDTGTYKIGNPEVTLRNAGSQAFGPVNLSRALTVSSDVYFYDLGARFCPGSCRTGIQETARNLGFGGSTEVELPYESDGRVPDADTKRRLHESNPEAFKEGKWYTGDNLNLAIGQGDTVATPLQLANAYATFANGGTLYAPRVGGEVLDPEGRVLRRIEPRVLQRTDIPASSREPMMTGLRNVVASPEGTGFAAFNGFPLARLPVAAKTGTAQVSGKQDTSLFAAFVPANTPEYAVAVVVEEAGPGAAAAAPVARALIDRLMNEPVTPVTRLGGHD